MSAFKNQSGGDLQGPFSSDNVILSVRDLTVRFHTRRGIVEALRGVSFNLKKQQVLGIVGESGSGKSVLALSLLNLIEEPGRILKGEVVFKGRDLLKLNRKDMNRIRGGQISMIFSDPMSAFDPTLTVGSQIVETIRQHHNGISKSRAKQMAIELFRSVKIPSPRRRFEEFPYMYSGGMIQRAMIADALSSNPEFIIADNPTQALDVTIQAQILELIAELRESHGTTIILITNSLPVLARYADEIMVLYAGSVLEHGEKHSVLRSPSHPYTMGLIASIPSMTGERLKRLKTIRGFTPDRLQTEITSASCLFADRCSVAMDVCFIDSPDAALVRSSGVHFAKCFRASELQELSAL